MDASRVANIAVKTSSMSKKKILSDEWVAELFSVNSEVSDTEHDCLSISSEDIKNANETLQDTNDKRQNDEQRRTDAVTDIKIASPKNQSECKNKSSFVIGKECYRDESNSSENESDSSSSVDPNSDSSNSSLEYMKKRTNPPEKRFEKKVKTHGELGLEDLPPIEALSISVLEKESELIGKVHSIVEQLVAVRAIKGLAPIDLDSVLFLSHGRPLGRVFDVFGPVTEPFYCIRFNNGEEIKAKLIEIGMDVFYAPRRSDMTKFVFVDQLKAQKGSDASWTNNNEPPEGCLDFSNDEEERNAKKQLKKRNCVDVDVDANADVDAVQIPVPIVEETPASFPHPVQFDTASFFRGQYIAPAAPHQDPARIISPPHMAFNTYARPATPLYAMGPRPYFGQFNHQVPSPVPNPVSLVPHSSYPQWRFSQPLNFMRPNPGYSPSMMNPQLMNFAPRGVTPQHVPLAIQVPPNYLRSPPPVYSPQYQFQNDYPAAESNTSNVSTSHRDWDQAPLS